MQEPCQLKHATLITIRQDLIRVSSHFKPEITLTSVRFIAMIQVLTLRDVLM